MKLGKIEGDFFIKLVYYLCSIVLCIFLLLVGNIKFDKIFVVIFFLPIGFMFIKNTDIKKKNLIDKFDFINYLTGILIDFFIILGISFVVVLVFAFFKWYRSIIIFFNLLIDAFIAKNVFFTRLGLLKFKYKYEKSIGIVLKNSICVFIFLINLFLLDFFSKKNLENIFIWLIILCSFYLVCFFVLIASLCKRKFLLTDFFKIQRYKFS